jgi:hypothetical protein
MKPGSIVKYKKPFPIEENVTFTVIEIEEATNWCLIKANVGMGSFNPTYTANISDLEVL